MAIGSPAFQADGLGDLVNSIHDLLADRHDPPSIRLREVLADVADRGFTGCEARIAEICGFDKALPLRSSLRQAEKWATQRGDKVGDNEKRPEANLDKLDRELLESIADKMREDEQSFRAACLDVCHNDPAEYGRLKKVKQRHPLQCGIIFGGDK